MTGSHGCICRQAERWRSRHQLRVVMRTDTVSSGPITCVVVSAMGATLHLMPPSRQAIFDDAKLDSPCRAGSGSERLASSKIACREGGMRWSVAPIADTTTQVIGPDEMVSVRITTRS